MADAFVERLRERTGRGISGVGRDALELLEAHSWPGNVRELINVMEYSFVVCKQGEIRPEHLPRELQGSKSGPIAVRTRRPGGLSKGDRDSVLQALEQCRGNRTEAAKLLGVSRVTLWKWLKQIEAER